MKKKFNDTNECLYCIGCKELIELGVEYLSVEEDNYTKDYHLICAPIDEDDESYIIKD